MAPGLLGNGPLRMQGQTLTGNDKPTEREAPTRKNISPRAKLNRAEQASITFLSAIQAGVFGWAAIVLPWQTFNWFSLLVGCLCAAHSVTVVLVLGGVRWALTAWKVSALIALVVLLVVSVQVFSGGAYLAGLYGSLGEGLFAALLAIWGLFVLLTLPTSCWALVRTRDAIPRLGRLPWIGALGACVVVGGASLIAHHQSSAVSLFEEEAEAELAGLSAVLGNLPENTPMAQRRGKAWHVSRRSAARCDAAPRQSRVTLIATFTRRANAGYRSSCVQDDNLANALSRLQSDLLERAAKGPIKVDLITGVANARSGPAWLETFKLRPALDGVCLSNRCWMPWQLLARNAFVDSQPLSFLPDLRFGVDLAELQKQLTAEDTPSDAALTRITTRSWVLQPDGLTRVERMRPVDVSLTDDSLAAALNAAEAHIVRAQLKDGKFRYMLHPFSQYEERKNFNLARQAGTLLALCELGTDNKQLSRTIQRGLKLLQRYETSAGNIAGLSQKRSSQRVKLGDSALPLTAFIQCRKRVGSRFDETIARLTNLVLALQDRDGSFQPEFDLKGGKVRRGPEPLYAPGQAILALTLLEDAVRRQPIDGLPDAETLKKARLLAMSQVANAHWPSSLYPFFFIEENWNCLASRAALHLERHDAYERFCLDYIAFKSRLILEEDSDVDPHFVGGFGFGNIIPPHNTGAAGFGEALAAAIAVKKARNETIVDEQALLRHVLTFLQRQQWTEHNCFGCTVLAMGALSEHTHSAITRIDFVQHAWAAMGHGQQALTL